MRSFLDVPEVVGALLLSIFTARTDQHTGLLQESDAVEQIWVQTQFLKEPGVNVRIAPSHMSYYISLIV